jgi:hypothetical protein
VGKYVLQEFTRTCLVAYESLPKNVHHAGWGRPGEFYSKEPRVPIVFTRRNNDLTWGWISLSNAFDDLSLQRVAFRDRIQRRPV